LIFTGIAAQHKQGNTNAINDAHNKGLFFRRVKVGKDMRNKNKAESKKNLLSAKVKCLQGIALSS
jgi:hypothetical protein